ncbi:LuxR C-terminal-related transcriptional regulator [Sphingomonas tabacisoli]|uniref:LuxR C-terminal-related transcriptional regulator n=1 Tax=Sphingomonas tabacisoli TaxID=2249466 RepID=A0ABW4I6F0_9SPHN
MNRTLRTQPLRGKAFPATARLRAEILIAPDAESLVSLFANALHEHGIGGHFCLRKNGGGYAPLVGDAPELIGRAAECIVIDTDESFMAGTRVLLAPPREPLGREQLTRLRGYAELFAARAIALQELADDVATDCGLTLRERYVLGRRLAGLATIDIAAESKLTIATIGTITDNAVDKLGCSSVAEAIAFAARLGWLAVTSLENCSSSSEKLTYKATQNG